jgi:hypothetical protein
MSSSSKGILQTTDPPVSRGAGGNLGSSGAVIIVVRARKMGKKIRRAGFRFVHRFR